jgi:hypothetical protein
MTRPSEIKPREGSVPGTTYAQFVEGRELGPVRFQITPDICEEYINAVEADKQLYRVDGRQAAPPNVLLPYMTVPMYQTYPPNQGIVMAELDMRFHSPIWADETTDVVASGRVTRKFEKRGRRYIEWEATFRRENGPVIATLTNRFHIPE